jgi:hypothetical protein
MPTNNKNFLGPSGFRLVFDRLPNVVYFSQSTSIPSITLGTITVSSPILDYPIPGEKLTYSPFDVTFRVDENMENYLEIMNWLVGLGSPQTTETRRLLTAKMFNGIYSDATLVILSSKYNPNLRVKFHNMFPETLSELRFETTDPDVTYLQATASFRYSLFTVERV